MDNIPDNISDIIAGLSDDDLNALKETAQSFFSQNEQNKSAADGEGFSLSPDMLLKIGNIMSAMNGKSDGRDNLIAALKPYLSRKRQQKADEAMQLLRLMDILPTIMNL
ncbi:MAG: hypothetical protein IJB86_06425 [Clostridia bacterium]|nr:hypothetical protein [Clostridia bacterium]MBQ7054889.1 hypothetical protein [Oscillospiraceae bacterium]